MSVIFKDHGKHICGFIFEPIQGEAGVVLPPEGYLKKVRDLCTKHNILMIADEIQTGIARTGKMLACDWEDIRPDVVILGKALGAGVIPVSAVLADKEIMLCIRPGEHGSAFGGNPLASAVAISALNVIKEEGLVERASTLGQEFRDQLMKIKQEFPNIIREVRGRGLLNAIDLDGKALLPVSAYDICIKLKERGILAKPTHGTIIRLAPPLTIRKTYFTKNLRKIEDIVNKQIKEELDVFAKEADLNGAKRVNGLRAVFGETYPNPVRIVAIGRKVEDLLIDPDNKEWLSYSTELCGGTHISNTREAKAFALLSEEGIAKGIRRVTAVTTNCAINANELADSFDAEISDASKAEGSELEKKIASLKNRTDAAAIPAARKAELRAKISQLQAQLIEEKKRLKEENIQKAINVANETAEAAASEGKAFCVIRLDVSADVAAVQQKAVLKVKDQKGLAVMVISIDESSNKAHVCAGVPTNKSKDGFEVLEWLKASMGPIKGRGGGGKNGIAQGQGTDISGIEEAMDLASKFAAMKLR